MLVIKIVVLKVFRKSAFSINTIGFGNQKKIASQKKHTDCACCPLIPESPAEPLVHIYLTDEETDLDEWVFTAMDTQEGDVHNGVLIEWNPAIETWVDQSWAYSLRLTSLNILTDVRSKIVNPVLALLSTDDLASVSDSLIDVEGIVHYE